MDSYLKRHDLTIPNEVQKVTIVLPKSCHVWERNHQPNKAKFTVRSRHNPHSGEDMIYMKVAAVMSEQQVMIYQDIKSNNGAGIFADLMKEAMAE